MMSQVCACIRTGMGAGMPADGPDLGSSHGRLGGSFHCSTLNA